MESDCLGVASQQSGIGTAYRDSCLYAARYTMDALDQVFGFGQAAVTAFIPVPISDTAAANVQIKTHAGLLSGQPGSRLSDTRPVAGCKRGDRQA